MENKIKLLENYFNAFANSDNPKEFFIGLRYYFDFVEETPEFHQILGNLLAEGKAIEDGLTKLENAAIKKITEAHKEIYDYILQNKLEQNPLIKQALDDYNGYLAGRIRGGSKAEGMQEEIADIIQWLDKKPEHKEFTNRFIIWSEHKAYIRHYFYPEEYKVFWEIWQDVKGKYQSELWGQVREILRHIEVIKTGREKKRELVKEMFDKNNSDAAHQLISSHVFLLGEWQKIEEGKHDKLSFYKIENYRPGARLFQNYLLKEASKISQTNTAENQEQKTFTVSVKDREIWINNYLISKPLATGGNYEFFEYVRSKPENTEIKRKDLPEKMQELSLKAKIRNKTFSKILNELGFKGQILKAFFYKRRANSIFYKGDKITSDDLENAGVKIKALMIELELANAKNSPK